MILGRWVLVRVGTSGVSLTPRSCDDPDKGLPAGAPQLEVGKWVDISPPGLAKQDPEQMIGQGITMEPCMLTADWL